MKLKKINKKGSIQDIFFFLIIIFGLALFIIVVGYVVTQITTEMKATSLNQTPESMAMLGYSESVVNQFDYVFLIVFGGLIIGILISSFMIESHPIFLPIYIFLLGFGVVVSVILSRVYDTFVANADLAATAARHTFATAVIDHLVAVMIGVGVLSMIIIFAKARTGGGRI